MGKVIKKSAGDAMFAKGGSTHMHGKGHAAPAPAGQSMHDSQPGGGSKWAEGGKGKMFGEGHARAAEAGVSTKGNQ